VVAVSLALVGIGAGVLVLLVGAGLYALINR
jgi:hypothetical protein